MNIEQLRQLEQAATPVPVVVTRLCNHSGPPCRACGAALARLEGDQP